jgi:DNA-binding response OmpR family regulator
MGMEMLKLLIADGTEEFSQALCDALRGAYYVRACADGCEALELLRTYSPDVLVLDLMLPGLDGISLLQQATAAGICPMVLATSRFLNDYVLEAADRMGVGYLMRKPCDVHATVARIADLSRHIRQPIPAKPDTRTRVSNLLLALGVPTKLRGYAYLREAILLMASNPGQSITKELYPAVGELCNSTAMHVERSARSAIAAAWEHRDINLWNLYFPPNGRGCESKPTNAAFISRLANGLLNCEE